tara:strand:- start:112 stop:468 length:357 start_codon:yes stop_codon:yes gene_type:complete
MNFFILFLLIVLSAEILIQSKYILLFNSLIKLNIKAYKIIVNKNVSDNWKEKIIPEYSLRMIKISLAMLLNLVFIILLFFMTSLFVMDFLTFVFSLKGIMASILFSFGYVYLKNLFKK